MRFDGFSVLTILMFLCLISASSFADEYCDEQWACAGAQRVGESLDFWIANRKAYPITLTLQVKTHYLREDDVTEGQISGRFPERYPLKKQIQQHGEFEITRVLQGNEKITVLQLLPTKRWQDIRYRYSLQWTVGDMHAKHDEAALYRKPYAEGHYYPVIQGYNGGYSHQGASRYAIDFAMPIGTPVHAARSGTVVDVQEHHWRGGANRRFAKYANFVVILHDDGTTGEYYHLKQWGVAVDIGESVKTGDLLGYSGTTGFSSTPHLHFAVYKAKSHGDYQSIPVRFNSDK